MPVFFSSGSSGEPEVVSDRILTVPNLLSVIRLLFLPWIYSDIVTGRFIRALIVLFIVVWSDFIDGYVARRFNQVSRIGQLMDPISDRILVVVVGIAMIVGDVLPVWAVVLLVARDAIMLLGGLFLLGRKVSPPPVTDLGKAATFGLMGVLPLFLLGAGLESAQIRTSAWVLYAIYVTLYYLAAAQYANDAFAALRAQRQESVHG